MNPRPFSDQEREQVRERLIQVAGEHFGRHGYRRANVAEIAADAGIAKGSLYLFFPSKSELFIAVALEIEEGCRRWLVDELSGPFPTPAAKLMHFLRCSAQVIQQSPILAVMIDPQEAAALDRDLPVEIREQLHASDDRFFQDLAVRWQEDGTLTVVDPDLVAALPRAIFALLLQRDLIGSSVFPAVLDFVIASLSHSLAPESG